MGRRCGGGPVARLKRWPARCSDRVRGDEDRSTATISTGISQGLPRWLPPRRRDSLARLARARGQPCQFRQRRACSDCPARGFMPTPRSRFAVLHARAHRGTTLLEIMIVLAILAIVMGLLVGPTI